MNRRLLFASLLFAVLTFCGAGYVRYTGSSAGYAVIPMLGCILCRIASSKV